MINHDTEVALLSTLLFIKIKCKATSNFFNAISLPSDRVYDSQKSEAGTEMKAGDMFLPRQASSSFM